MKVQANQINKYLQDLPKNIKFILVYGSDAGLVDQRVKILAKTFLDDNDLTDMEYVYEQDLKSDNQLLANKMNNLSLFGSAKKVIIMREMKDFATKHLIALLPDISEDVLIIAQADELSTSSPLRKLAENDPSSLSIPCYQDNAIVIKDVILKTLAKEQIAIDSNALNFLVTNLGNNRLITLAELEKLILYKYQTKKITLNDVMESVVDQSTFSYDSFSYALFSFNINQAYHSLCKLLEDESPITIIRILMNYLQKLHLANLDLAGGTPINEIISSIKPPIFFSYVDIFKSQLNIWSSDKLKDLFKVLVHLEVINKTHQCLGEMELKNFVINFKKYA